MSGGANVLRNTQLLIGVMMTLSSDILFINVGRIGSQCH